MMKFYRGMVANRDALTFVERSDDVGRERSDRFFRWRDASIWNRKRAKRNLV